MGVSLGADPEFILCKPDNEILDAEVYIDGASDDEGNQVGIDGAGEVGELRPPPEDNAILLANGVKSCLTQLYTVRLNNGDNFPIKAVGGSGDQSHPIGGHIHFGIPEERGLVRAFNAASLLMLHLEHYPENKYRRYDGDGDDEDGYGNDYGQLSDTRDQDWGFEYRVPASWLVNPPVTRGTLCLYHAIALAWKADRLPAGLEHVGADSIDDDFKLAFNKGRTAYFKNYMPKVVNAIQRLPAYQANRDYRRSINYLLAMYRKGKQWQEKRDIFSTWGIKNNRNCLMQYTGDFFMGDFDDINAPGGRRNGVYVYGRKKHEIDEGRNKRFGIWCSSDKLKEVIEAYLKRRRIQADVHLEDKMFDESPLVELGLSYYLRSQTKVSRGILHEVKRKMSENYNPRKRIRKRAGIDIWTKRFY